MKIRPVGADLFHADGQTDMTMLIVNLTLYVPRIMFQCVDKPTRCNTSYE